MAWQDTWKDAHSRAFIVSAGTSPEKLEAFQALMAEAVSGQWSLQDLREKLGRAQPPGHAVRAPKATC